MPTIATNYFDKLTELEKEEIKEAGKVFGDVKLYEYIQKGAGLEEFIKFILSDFNLKNLILICTISSQTQSHSNDNH